MEQKEQTRLWLHYSSYWRKVMTHVLELQPEAIEQRIAELKRDMEDDANNPHTHGFFFDPPSRSIWTAIIGDLFDKCTGNESGPFPVYQRLDKAISGGLNHWMMDEEGFDWNQARKRYRNEYRKTEEWLTAFKTR